ncbi:PREDICTED: uncharacterized protein LOC107334247 [Acropora digitifera]|uniref:uncharacterized protein LOC107334247 n=1 Tax=Acropora digitifera TaxID=70779 RepID=UPI00077A2F1C|nr:PREDICTED: uncharacterized protein LOC107334247 [Acropora digitifera]
MIFTRSQSRRNTRSTGKAPTLSAVTVGRKAGSKLKVKSKSKKASNPRWTYELKDQKIFSIFWNLFVRFFPNAKIVLEPYKSSNPVLVFVVIVVCLVGLAIYPFWSRTSNMFWWYGRNTRDTAGVYFNEVLWPPRHRWIWREEEVLNVTAQIRRLCKDHSGRQVHMYLIGGPGSGKSELARQVGLNLNKTMKEITTRPVDVLTIRADSSTSLMSGLVDAVFALCNSSGQKVDGIKQMKEELNFRFNDLFSNEGNNVKMDIRVKVLFTKLKELFRDRNSQPVIIFDNVQDLKLLFKYLNLEPGSEHYSTFVIVITHQKRVSLERLSAYVRVVDLFDGMMANDSIKLLELITGLKDDREKHALELSNILGNQPLAIATAAIYIESVREGPPKNAKYSYSDYISEFKRDISLLGVDEEIEWLESDASKYPAPMYKAVLKAVNHSAQTDPVFREIVCIGYTDSSPLSLTFVMNFLNTSLHHKFSKAQIRNSLKNVLFKVTGKEGHQSLSSHQVIREAFRQVCKASSLNSNCSNLTDCHLPSASIKGNVKTSLNGVFSRLTLSIEKELNASLLNLHSIKINGTVSAEPQHSFDSVDLDILTSLCFFSSREHLQVKELLSTHLTGTFLRLVSYNSGFWPSLLRPTSNEFRLAKIVNLTNMLAVKGKQHDLQTLLLVVCLYSGAAKLQNQQLLLALNRTSRGILQVLPYTIWNNDRAFVLNTLGAIYNALGFPYNSRKLHELALELHYKSRNVTIDQSNINKNKHQAEHDDPENILLEAGTLHKLGVINRYLSNLSAAQANHETSLELLQNLLGLQHPFVAGSLLNLAVVYSRQGNYSNALKVYYQSLAILLEKFGPRHASVGRVFVTIATVNYKMGEFKNAIDNCEHGMEILQDFHGTNHPHVAEALNFLGFMYRDNGNLEKAQEVLEHSVMIKEKVFDKDHFILGEALNDLGNVYTRLGKAEKATKILERALTIFKQTWGQNHSSLAVVLNSLGAAYCASNQLQKALNLHQTALKILLSKRNKEIKNHFVAETRHLLGKTYLAIGNLKDGKDMFHLSFMGFSQIYGMNHWRVQSVLQDLNSVVFISNKSPLEGVLFTHVTFTFFGCFCNFLFKCLKK